MRAEDERPLGFATRALHTGQGPDPETGAVVQPIHLASTYAQDAVGRHRGFEYSRSNNPTRQALEESLAGLEGADAAFAFASGLAATSTLLLLLSPGDHVVLTDDVYGGTFRLFHSVLTRLGLRFTQVEAANTEALREAITPQTRLVWVETPTNPLLRITDIGAFSDVAHERGALVCVDNTFASPVLQNPLTLGADVVMHSATKYIGGHSDVVGGALMTSRPALIDSLRYHQNAIGAVPSPFDCWLLLRGIKTLALRVQRQCENAAALAAFLDEHPAIERVHYPGLISHPGHEVAARQMRGFGGMVSFEVSDEATALATLDAMRLFTLAESLGAVESLAEHPGLMTHASIPVEVRRAAGLSDGLIRLSVGIEDIADLIADMEQSLTVAAAASSVVHRSAADANNDPS